MSNRLNDIIGRIEFEAGVKAQHAEEIKAIYMEVKAAGYNVRAIKEIVRDRRMDKDKLAAYESARATYRSDLGMEGTPLGEAATRRETVKAELRDENGEVIWASEVPA